MRRFIEQSPARRHRRRADGRPDVVRLYHDHVLVKEPGTRQRTPWHQDLPVLQRRRPAERLDVVPRRPGRRGVDAGVRRRLAPRAVVHAAVVPRRPGQVVPRRHARRAARRSTTTPSASASSAGASSRATRCSSTCSRCTPPAASAPGAARVLSVRFLGDDMVHAPRPWTTSPPFPGLVDELAAGAPMDHPLFPVLWIAGDTSDASARSSRSATRCSASGRPRSIPPTSPGDELQELIADLIDTMRAANGAGIAANQIGVPSRVAVIEVNDNPRYPYKPPIPLTVVINPVIEAARRRAGGDQRGLPVGAQPPRHRAPPREHPRALARRARHAPRRGATAASPPARSSTSATTSTACCSSIGSATRPRSPRGSSSSASTGRLRRADHPLRRACRLLTRWRPRRRRSGASWPGSGRTPPTADGVLVTVDGGHDHRRRRRRRRRHRPAPPRSPGSPCPASPTPTATPSTAPCAGAPTTAAARSGRGASRCTRSPRRSIPTRTSAWRRRRSPRWSLAGITVVGEFHYLHHGPGGVPYADANAIGRRLLRAADDGRHAHHAARHLLPARRHRRRPEHRAAALHRRHGRRRGPSASTALADGASPPCPARRRRPLRARRRSARRSPTSRRGPSERGAVLHAHVSEQPAENDRLLAAHGCTPVELLAATPALDERFTRGPRHPRHVARHRAARRRRRRCCICPTTERDLADGIGPTVGPARRRGRAVPRIGLARGDRPVRGGARRRARRAAGVADGGGPTTRRPCCGAATADGLPRASAGRRRHDRCRQRRRPRDRRPRRCPPRRARPRRPGRQRRVRGDGGRRAPRRRRRRARRSRRRPTERSTSPPSSIDRSRTPGGPREHHGRRRDRAAGRPTTRRSARAAVACSTTPGW